MIFEAEEVITLFNICALKRHLPQELALSSRHQFAPRSDSVVQGR